MGGGADQKERRPAEELTADEVGQRRVQVAGQHFPRMQRDSGAVDLSGRGRL